MQVPLQVWSLNGSSRDVASLKAFSPWHVNYCFLCQMIIGFQYFEVGNHMAVCILKFLFHSQSWFKLWFMELSKLMRWDNIIHWKLWTQEKMGIKEWPKGYKSKRNGGTVQLLVCLICWAVMWVAYCYIERELRWINWINEKGALREKG